MTVAKANNINAGIVPIQAKSPFKSKIPNIDAKLIRRGGTKTRNPHAELKPIPPARLIRNTPNSIPVLQKWSI